MEGDMLAKRDVRQENERKKEYLRSYREALRREREILWEIRKIRSERMSPSAPSMDGMPRGGGNGGLDAYIALLERKEKKLETERLDAAVLREEIEAQIRLVPDADERRVLRLRYIEGMGWDRVAATMGYSRRQALRIHGRALLNFELPEKLSHFVTLCHTLSP